MSHFFIIFMSHFSCRKVVGSTPPFPLNKFQVHYCGYITIEAVVQMNNVVVCTCVHVHMYVFFLILYLVHCDALHK